MNFDIQLFLCAVGLAFTFEALPWILFPDTMRKVMLSLAVSPKNQLRAMGLFALCLGLGLVWIGTSFINT